MNKELKEKYIQLSSNLLFNKHFYKIILEKKHIENFGDLELIKMKNIYETMIINKKLEENFSMANDNSIQYSNLVDYKARKEFFDLERQIKELEDNIRQNNKTLKELEFFNAKGIKSAFEVIIRKTNPFVNSSKVSKGIWLDFTKALDKNNWKRVFRLSSQAKDLRVYSPKIEDEELEEAINDMESMFISLKNRFPFTQIEILEDEENIKLKKDEEKRDLKNMKESYLKMADIYLSTTVTPEWYS